MKKIIDRVFVGDKEDSPQALKDGFAVASMLKEELNGHRYVLGYTTLLAPHDENYYFVRRGKHFSANLIDIDDPEFIPEEVINPALDFIKDFYNRGDKILIHCEKGHSRGLTTALMFLRAIGEFPYSYRISEKIFKTLYLKFSLGKGMEIYAKRHWKELENRYAKY